MKRVFSVIMALCLAMSCMTSIAYAAEDVSTDYDGSKATSLWPLLKEGGYLLANENGLLVIVEDNPYTTYPKYDEFIDIINMCNGLVLDEVLEVDREKIELSTVSTYDADSAKLEFERNMEEKLSSYSVDTTVNPRSAAHGCSYNTLNLLSLCENNYQTIVSNYNTMVDLQVYNPSIDPWVSTVGFWVGHVVEGGQWDYKSLSGYVGKTFCCYFDGGYHDVTSEYIGNFNYGYTGSFLFTLGVLLEGSAAVGGGKEVDQHDWPAINAGYYAKVG